MLKRLSLLFALIPTLAGAVRWQLDPATTIAADVGWEGSNVVVRFPSFSGVIDFDEARPQNARATISVATTAATTGLPVADQLLRSRDYLDAADYPTMTFRLGSLRRTSPQTADIAGEITLRGVTRPISFTAKVVRYGPAKDDPSRFQAGFDLSGCFDRTAFGSTGGVPDVAAVLPIRIRLLMQSK